MRYRQLSRGALQVSELCFGAWLTEAGAIGREQAVRTIHAAVDHGITLFDTANQYGAGEAERVLGVALKADPPFAGGGEIETHWRGPGPHDGAVGVGVDFAAERGRFGDYRLLAAGADCG